MTSPSGAPDGPTGLNPLISDLGPGWCFPIFQLQTLQEESSYWQVGQKPRAMLARPLDSVAWSHCCLQGIMRVLGNFPERLCMCYRWGFSKLS